MGKVLIIKGADFSSYSIDTVPVDGSGITIEQGVINLVKNGDYQGNYMSSTDSGYAKRLRVISTDLIYIESEQTVTLSGLTGSSGSSTALRIDAAIYTTNEAAHDNLNTDYPTLNGNTTNYYPFNTDGSETYSFTAPATGYYAFCFASQDKDDEISYEDYESSVSVLVE